MPTKASNVQLVVWFHIIKILIFVKKYSLDDQLS